MYLRNSSRKMTGREKQSTANHSVQFRGVIWKTVCYDGKEGGACARGVWVGPCSVHCTWQSHAFLHCVALVSGRSYMQCRTCSLPLKVMATSWLLFLCLVISKKSCWWTLAWWQVETEESTPHTPPPPPPPTHTHTHTVTQSHTHSHGKGGTFVYTTIEGMEQQSQIGTDYYSAIWSAACIAWTSVRRAGLVWTSQMHKYLIRLLSTIMRVIFSKSSNAALWV